MTAEIFANIVSMDGQYNNSRSCSSRGLRSETHIIPVWVKIWVKTRFDGGDAPPPIQFFRPIL